MNIYISNSGQNYPKKFKKRNENILEFPPIILRHTIMQEKSNERSHKKCLNKTENNIEKNQTKNHIIIIK